MHAFGEEHLHALGNYTIANIDVSAIALLTPVAIPVVGSQARDGHSCQALRVCCSINIFYIKGAILILVDEKKLVWSALP